MFKFWQAQESKTKQLSHKDPLIGEQELTGSSAAISLEDQGIYTDFFQLSSSSWLLPEQLQSQSLSLMPEAIMQQVLAKPIASIKRELGLELSLEVSLLDPLLQKAMAAFYSLPWQASGFYAWELGSLQYFLYSTHAGLRYYRMNIPKSSLLEKSTGGLYFVVVNFLRCYLLLSKRVSISALRATSRRSSVSQAHTEVNTQFNWGQEFNLFLWSQQRQQEFIEQIRGLNATTKLALQLLQQERLFSLHWVESQNNEITAFQLKQLEKVISRLIPASLQQLLNLLFPSWRTDLITALRNPQGASNLAQAFTYAEQAAYLYAQEHLAYDRLKPELERQQEYYLRQSEALAQELLQSKQNIFPIERYLVNTLAYYQLQQHLYQYLPKVDKAEIFRLIKSELSLQGKACLSLSLERKEVFSQHRFLALLQQQLRADLTAYYLGKFLCQQAWAELRYLTDLRLQQQQAVTEEEEYRSELEPDSELESEYETESEFSSVSLTEKNDSEGSKGLEARVSSFQHTESEPESSWTADKQENLAQAEAKINSSAIAKEISDFSDPFSISDLSSVCSDLTTSLDLSAPSDLILDQESDLISEENQNTEQATNLESSQVYDLRELNVGGLNNAGVITPTEELAIKQNLIRNLRQLCPRLSPSLDQTRLILDLQESIDSQLKAGLEVRITSLHKLNVLEAWVKANQPCNSTITAQYSAKVKPEQGGISNGISDGLRSDISSEDLITTALAVRNEHSQSSASDSLDLARLSRFSKLVSELLPESSFTAQQWLELCLETKEFASLNLKQKLSNLWQRFQLFSQLIKVKQEDHQAFSTVVQQYLTAELELLEQVDPLLSSNEAELRSTEPSAESTTEELQAEASELSISESLADREVGAGNLELDNLEIASDEVQQLEHMEQEFSAWLSQELEQEEFPTIEAQEDLSEIDPRVNQLVANEQDLESLDLKSRAEIDLAGEDEINLFALDSELNFDFTISDEIANSFKAGYMPPLTKEQAEARRIIYVPIPAQSLRGQDQQQVSVLKRVKKDSPDLELSNALKQIAQSSVLPVSSINSQATREDADLKASALKNNPEKEDKLLNHSTLTTVNQSSPSSTIDRSKARKKSKAKPSHDLLEVLF